MQAKCNGVAPNSFAMLVNCGKRDKKSEKQARAMARRQAAVQAVSSGRTKGGRHRRDDDDAGGADDGDADPAAGRDTLVLRTKTLLSSMVHECTDRASPRAEIPPPEEAEPRAASQRGRMPLGAIF